MKPQELKQKMKLQLVRQHDITIARGEAPLIYCGHSYFLALDDACQCVNFLRAGCPSVQLTFECTNDKKKEVKNFSQEILDSLALSDEQFTIEINKPKKGCDIVVVTVIRDKKESSK